MATPFETAYTSLLAELVESVDLAELVAPANIVRHDTDVRPDMQDRGDGDLPALDVVPGDMEFTDHATSDTAEAIMHLQLRLYTAQELLADPKGLWALTWAVSRCLYKAGFAASTTYIIDYDWQGFTNVAPSDSDKAEGFGWQAVGNLDLRLEIARTELSA